MGFPMAFFEFCPGEAILGTLKKIEFCPGEAILGTLFFEISPSEAILGH